jgi:integrase
MQGLYQRGKVWWIDTVFRGRRIRKSLNTQDRRLAERIYHKIKTQIIEGQWFEAPKGSDKNFEHLMHRYLTEHSPRKSPLSRLRDQSLANHLRDFFGETALLEISKRLVGEYKAKRRRDEAAPATINKELGLLKHAFNLAVKEWEWLDANHLASVSLEPVNNARDRWLTWEEERALLEASPDWLKEIVVFALNTGMRLGEIVNLKWHNVDLTRSTMTLVRSKNQLRGTLPINSRVFEILMMKGGQAGCDYVFCSKVGTRLFARNLRRTFVIAREKAGLTDVRFHDLRHTFATRLVQNGVDLYRVQRLLGHKTHVMTQRYAHHYPESLRSAVKVLETAGYDTITSQSRVNQGGGNS